MRPITVLCVWLACSAAAAAPVFQLSDDQGPLATDEDVGRVEVRGRTVDVVFRVPKAEHLAQHIDLKGKTLTIHIDGAPAGTVPVRRLRGLARVSVHTPDRRAAQLLAQRLRQVSPCMPLTPGRALGAYRMGRVVNWANPKMDRSEPGLVVRVDDAGRPRTVTRRLPACVVYRGRAVEAGTVLALAARLGTCGPRQPRIDGATIDCHGVRFDYGRSMGFEPGQITVFRPSERRRRGCAVYLDTGFLHDARGTHEMQQVRVGLGRGPVCAGYKRVTVRTSAAQLLRDKACVARRGGRVVTCNLVDFVFGGAGGSLSRVELAL